MDVRWVEIDLPCEGIDVPCEGIDVPCEGIDLPREGSDLPCEGTWLPRLAARVPRLAIVELDGDFRIGYAPDRLCSRPRPETLGQWNQASSVRDRCP